MSVEEQLVQAKKIARADIVKVKVARKNVSK